MPEQAIASGKTNLTHASIGNFRWSALTTASTSGAQFVISIILMRILEPKDFGVVAYAMVFVMLTSRITEFGIAPAIVQAKDLNRHHLRVGFTLTVFLAATCYLGLFMVAPHVASGIRMRVLRVAGLSLVISSVGLVATSTLQRQLRFKDLFYIVFLSSVVGYGLVSVTLALLGYGPWSLVLGNIAQLILRNAACYVASPHSIVPSMRREEVRELLTYGFGMSLGTLANIVAKNGHIFVVGRVLGDALLGVYQRAYTLVLFSIGVYSRASIAVLFPTLARVQTDRDRLRRGYITSVSLTSFVLFPIMTWVAVCAPEIVIGLLTRKWEAMIPLIRVFCLLGVFASIYPMGDALGRACGRVYIKSMIHVVYAITSIGLCYVAAFHGVLIVAGAMVVSVIITYSLMGILVTRILDISFFDFMGAQLPGICSSVVIFGICYPATWLGRSVGIPEIGLLVIQALTAIASLAVALLCLPEALVRVPRKIFREHLRPRVLRGLARPVLGRMNS
ncbi:MAG: lipopolysaccharide biosynthesis protein [Sedimentisphaerales bacterium]|nr:lipopolysaccharide biosynthesis protein [Sedimentisphaerales bacterium]